MFKRSLQVHLVKTPKQKKSLVEGELETEFSEDDEEFQIKLDMAEKFIRDLVYDGAKLFAAYMILDTARKVTIAKAVRTCLKC